MGQEPDDDSGLLVAPATPDTLAGKVFEARLEARILGGAPVLPRVDRFVLERVLGTGGMGTVWLARDEKLGRPVALKLVQRGGTAGERMRLREARGLARIAHPNVIGVHDVGEHDGRVWLAMEYVPGRTLRECAGELERDAALAHWLAAGRGLAAIHAAGLVHRDVKPDNVLLGDDGRVRIIDLGLAREVDVREPVHPADADTRPELVQTLGFVGTRAYAAPEQLRGEPVDARADQYAYAVAALESLRAARPRPGAADEPLPEALLAALGRASHADPVQRFATMTELVDALAGAARSARSPAAGLRPAITLAETVPLREESPRYTPPAVSLGTTVARTQSIFTAGAEPPRPLRIGHYEVLYELGRGGMGVVYAAHDGRLDRKVAIKRLLGGGSEQRNLLYREALALAKLSHPNVVPVYEIVEDRDSTYIVMEFVEGQTLREWLTIPRARDEVLAIYKAAARGLIAAHQKHLVHRDFKPENVMLGDDGRVRVMDFGLASVASHAPVPADPQGGAGGPVSELSQPGVLLGTPAYMSPEQLRTEPASPASDIFSFCVALYEALHGERPFAGRTLEELRASVASGAIRDAPAGKAVPAWLRALVCRGLATRPEDRFESMQALLDAIVAGELAADTDSREPPAYVFVAHDSRDKRAVLRLCERLIDHGVRPWLDLWELTPGADTRAAAEQALLAAPAVIVCGRGEHAAALAARSDRDPETVHGVRLPGAAEPPSGRRPVVTLDEARWDDAVLELARRIGVDPRRETWLAHEAARVGTTAEALSPYRGLEAFREQDARWMFGRDDEVAALLELIRAGQTRFFTLIGASGSGKSSLVTGGVCPMLRCGALGDARAWRITTMRPGTRPCEALAHALVHLEASGEADADAARLSCLRADLLACDDTLRIVLGRGRAEGTRTLLVIDQLEELFTEARLGTPEAGAEALAFVRNLLEATHELAALDGNLWIAATLRADFVQRALEVPELARALQVGTYFALPPMREDQIRAAVERPAARVGHRVDSRVVDRLIVGAAHQAGRLPLLQHVLRELWARRDATRRVLGEAAYAETGGLEGAIAVAASRALQGLRARLGDAGEVAARRLMTRLVHLGVQTSEDTRRRVTLASLGDDATTRSVLEALVREARVLVATEVDGAVTVEIAHEALLREWTTLVRWLDADRGALRLRQELAQDAARANSSNEYLWGRARVEEARRVLGASTVELDAAEQRFLAASERAVRRRRRWLQTGVGVLVLAALGMTGLGLYARNRQTLADEHARLADANAAEAAAQKAAADENAAEARVQQAAADETRDRARDAAWLAYARELRDVDPTLALLGLRNIRVKDTPGWLDEALAVLHEPIALLRVPGNEVRVSPDGGRILVHSSGDAATVWNITGPDAPVVLEHPGRVADANFSPDGRTIVTASADRSVRIWNADGSGAPIVFNGHTAPVVGASFSPDGRSILTSSDDKTVRVWPLDGSYAPIVHAAAEFRPSKYSPDGRILFFGKENEVHVRNADGSGRLVVLRETSEIWSANFSPDSRRIVVTLMDGTVHLRSAEKSGRPIVLMGDKRTTFPAAFDPEGRRIVTASEDGTVRVWNADGSGESIALEGHEGRVHVASFSPDGRRIVTAGGDATVRLWDARGSGQRVALKGHAGWVNSATFTSDCRYVASASSDVTVRVWAADGPIQTVLTHQNTVREVRFSPDGRRILTASGPIVRIWNADGSGEPVILQGDLERVASAQFSPDGRQVVTGSDEGTVRVWNADGSGEPAVLGGHESYLMDASFSPDGRRIVTVSATAMRVWNVEAPRALVAHFECGKYPHAAHFSPDSQRVVTSGSYGMACVMNADGSGERTILPGTDPDYAIEARFSPDGRSIVALARNQTMLIWNADSLGAPRVLAGPVSPSNLYFSPDSRRVLTTSRNDGVILDPAGSAAPVVLSGHLSTIWGASFSPDGRRVATASGDGTARVWNADGSKHLVLRGHQGPVYRVAFSPDGQRLATASEDRTVRVWDLDPSVVRAQLASATTMCMPVEERMQAVGETLHEACAAFAACEREHGRRPVAGRGWLAACE